MEKTRVIAAMSGGVDSAVAAGLLSEAGYDVVGVTMKMYSPSKPAHAKSCCGIDDFDDARRSAAILGIPHYVLDFEETFRKNVVDRFMHEYAQGRTPNPCVSCNNFVKLGALRKYADALGARYVATGHYARLLHEQDGPRLYASPHGKDQSYALSQLSVDQLARLLLPLGDLQKTQTREHARRLGLPVHDKRESQDICFVEGGDYRELVKRHAPQAAIAGDVVTASGERVGAHAGVGGFTIGQRRGLPASSDAPRYVTRIDPRTNTIVVGREEELFANVLLAGEVNLIRPERFSQPVPVRAMTRYRAAAQPAIATLRDGMLDVRFEQPVRAVAPGQLVALYEREGEEVLGAGTIRETL